MSAIGTFAKVAFPWNTAVQNADTVSDYVGGNRGLGRVIVGGVNAVVQGTLAYKAGEETVKQGSQLIANVKTNHLGDAAFNALGVSLFGLAAAQMATGAIASARSMVVNERKYGAEAKQ